MPHFFFVHKGGETGVSYSLSLSLSLCLAKAATWFISFLGLKEGKRGGDLNGAKCFRPLGAKGRNLPPHAHAFDK